MSTNRSIPILSSVTFFVSMAINPSSGLAVESGIPPGSWMPGVLAAATDHGSADFPFPGPVRPSPAPAEETAAAERVESFPSPPSDVPAAVSPAQRGKERDSDRVLSPRDVDEEIARYEEPEPIEELDDGFFDNAPVEVDKGKEGNYAGLTGRIEKFIRYFQTKGRDRFEIWLARSGKYSEMMRGILAKYGLPEELVYLALIESGFSPQAYSVARAAGPWQFISGTARRYGLRVDWWADERRDYEKATHAAASYLRDLYGMFESWPLAAAAYNAGEKKIARAVARYKSDDYAELIRHRYLARETKDYVPKMLAALSIAKEPDRYGFGNVRYEDPIAFDKVTVPGGTDLAAMGGIIGVHVDSLKELNPELRRFCTPPNRPEYEIRVPSGFGLIASERMEQIGKGAKVTFLRHNVAKGESLASLSETYRTPVSTLKEMNGLRSDSLRRVSRLVIPVTGLSPEDSAPGTAISPDQLKLAHMRADDGLRRGHRVRVRRGDTLSSIARRSGVSVRELMRANGIRDARSLRAGAILRIPRGGSASREENPAAVPGDGKDKRHVVRPGDTLWSIARAHGITVDQLADRNNMTPRQSLPCGRVLRIPTES